MNEYVHAARRAPENDVWVEPMTVLGPYLEKVDRYSPQYPARWEDHLMYAVARILINRGCVPPWGSEQQQARWKEMIMSVREEETPHGEKRQ